MGALGAPTSRAILTEGLSEVWRGTHDGTGERFGDGVSDLGGRSNVRAACTKEFL